MGDREDSIEELRARLVQRFPELLVAVGDALRVTWPEYAAYIDEHLEELTPAADLLTGRLLASGLGDGAMARRAAEEPVIAELFEQIGRRHFLHGEGITSLLAAYQSGAEVAWDLIADVAIDTGLGAGEIGRLAKTLFLVVHDLSVATSRGYIMEQSVSAMAVERARTELSGRLMSPYPDPLTWQPAADRAAWIIPELAAFVIIGTDHREPGHFLQTDPEWLLTRVDGVVGLIVPWVAGVRERLTRSLGAPGAVVGPPLPVTRLRDSMAVARSVVRLRDSGLLDGPMLFADDHLDVLLVHRQPRILEALRAQVLAPLAELPDTTRDRLIETLTLWLLHLGSRTAVARELHVHPQTVRYRLAQLRQAYGDALDDPTERARLLLALAWGEPRDLG